MRLAHTLVPRLKRIWSFRGLVLYVPRGVFNPVLTVSTSLLASLIEEATYSTFVEIGCGSGALTLLAARNGAEKAIGIDVDPLAVAVARVNARLNHLEHRVECVHGETVPRRLINGGVDLVAVNPPYLPCPAKPGDTAWCGGRGLEQLKRMFKGILLLRPRKLAIAFSTLAGVNLAAILEDAGFKPLRVVYRRLPGETVYAVLAVRHGRRW